jgi:DNA-binding response OmpR family regulator/nitrogen-specific signal transduction histidine kinase
MLRPCILIVDDSLTVRMDLAEAFEAAGFQALPVATVGEAGMALADHPVALAILDVRLPDGDGVELLRALRSVPATAELPVLMLSSEAEVGDRVRGLRIGADDYVGKPYDSHGVVARVRELLQGRLSGRAEGGAPILVIDDSPTFRAELSRALTQAGYPVVTAADGEAGLRIAAASRPRAIIVDGMMPGIDGGTVIRRLRLDAALRRTPAVLLTASAETSDELAALESGADAFARKDDDMMVILARLAALLRHTAQEPSETASVLGPKRLLAVDDSPTYLAELATVLGGEGYDVVSAQSGEEAIDLLSVQQVDCILLDLIMPGLGGQETCRRLKASPAYRDIPLIMLTADEERTVMIDGLRTGADDFIVKSSDFGIIMARVRVQLRRRQFETELVLQQEAIARSERLLRTVMDSVPDGVVMVDRGGEPMLWNRAAEAIRNEIRQAHTTVGADPLFFRPDRKTPVAHDALPLTRALRGEDVDEQELCIKTTDARKDKWCSVKARPLPGMDGRVTGAVAVFRDVTKEKEASEQLMISDRMVSIGMVAAGVAHEINNPLAAMLANLDLAVQEIVRRDTGDGRFDDLKELLQEARSASHRVYQIASDLRVFARREDDTPAAVDVHRVLESSLRMAGNEIRHRARLDRRYGQVPLVRGQESRLGQVFLNLLMNAAQAIPEGNVEGHWVRVATDVDGDGRVIVAISDTGCGMPVETLAQLFTPFFTTKPAGIGTGLGLAICQRIVEGFGGDIQVASELGRGSTFRVLLPVADQAVPTVPQATLLPPSPSQQRRILVVDDEVMIAKVIRRILADDHQVDTMTQAAEALGRIQAGERFDLILCDLMMPQMTGMEFHAGVMACDPDQARRLVFLTGGAFTVAAREFFAQMPNRCVEKPFTLEKLRQIVSESLDQGEP